MRKLLKVSFEMRYAFYCDTQFKRLNLLTNFVKAFPSSEGKCYIWWI
ncbi:MAG: hypothetical protein ACTS5P_00300 [Candidatus Hodgkinia cicadicola]